MRGQVRRHRDADRDLLEVFLYLGRHNRSAASRFLREVEATFQILSGSPELGTRYESEDLDLVGLRYFPVFHFKNYVIFYRTAPEGVEVLRVLHGARDIKGELADV